MRGDDDADVKAASAKITHALKTRTIPASPFMPSGLGLSVEEIVTVALDAVAPAIEARALREAATDGPLHFAATHTSRDARGWNVVEASWLRARADEIERTP